MFNPEKQEGAGESQGNKPDLPQEIIKLEAGLKETAAWLRSLGLPVDDECRLVMDEYAKAGFDLADIEKDKQKVEKYEERFAETDLRKGGVEKTYTLGEQMEKFSTVVMAKFFRKLAQQEQKQSQSQENRPMAVLRATRIDDIEEHIDYVIFDTKTGNIMGAVDVTVGEGNQDKNAIYDKKGRRIDGMNAAGRGKLKYGLGIDKNGIVLKSVEKLPVFLLNLPKKEFEKYLKSVDYEGEDLSKLENRIINGFLESMIKQIETFKEAGWASGHKSSFDKITAIYNRRTFGF